jgi:hypothetical protein
VLCCIVLCCTVLCCANYTTTTTTTTTTTSIQFVRDVMQGIPHCVSLIHENERLRKRRKASDAAGFSKEAMRSGDVHLWTDAYSDLPSIQDALGCETRMTLSSPAARMTLSPPTGE